MMSLVIPTTSKYVNDTDINIGVTPDGLRRASCYEIDFRLAKRRKIDLAPRENDVLFFGNAKMTCGHPGNVAFVDTIKKCLKTYQAYGGDIQISNYIVEGLTSQLPPVRFLHQNETTREWSTLSNLEAIVVTNHALMTSNKRQIETEKRQNEEVSVVPKYQKVLPQESRLDMVASDTEATKKSDTAPTLDSASTTTSLREMLWKGFSPSHMPPFECPSTCHPEKETPILENSPSTSLDEDLDCISLSDTDSVCSPCGVDDDLVWTEFDLENVFQGLESEDDIELFDLI